MSEFEIVPHQHCDCVREALHGEYLWNVPHVPRSMWMGQDAHVYHWLADSWMDEPPARAYPMRRIRETGAVLQMGPGRLAELEERERVHR